MMTSVERPEPWSLMSINRTGGGSRGFCNAGLGGGFKKQIFSPRSFGEDDSHFDGVTGKPAVGFLWTWTSLVRAWTTWWLRLTVCHFTVFIARVDRGLTACLNFWSRPVSRRGTGTMRWQISFFAVLPPKASPHQHDEIWGGNGATYILDDRKKYALKLALYFSNALKPLASFFFSVKKWE